MPSDIRNKAVNHGVWLDIYNYTNAVLLTKLTNYISIIYHDLSFYYYILFVNLNLFLIIEEISKSLKRH